MSDHADVSAIRVAVVLVNWNGGAECIECIDSVLAQAHGNFHIFIVDNDSKDGSIETIGAWCSGPEADPAWRRQFGVVRHTDRGMSAALKVRIVDRPAGALPTAAAGCSLTLIRAGGNPGYAGGCNVGVRAAGLEGFDYFWFLNPDTVVQETALVELIRRAQAGARIGMVGSTLLFYDAPDTVQALGGARLNPLNGFSWHIGEGSALADVPSEGSGVERELAYVVGASMLVSARFIREIGLMQEDYFLYYEEADWATRGRDQFLLAYAPRSHVFHKSGANSSKVMPLFTAGFYYRNRLRFVGRFLPKSMAAAKRTLFVEMLRHVVKGRWELARIVGSTLLFAPKA